MKGTNVGILLLIFHFFLSKCEQVEDKMYFLQHEEGNGTVEISTFAYFEEYITTGPRNYSSVILFTSQSEELQCKACSYIEEQLGVVANWYQSSVQPAKRDIFFFVVEWSHNRDIFFKYKNKIKEMPFLVRLPPTTKVGAQFKWSPEDKINLTPDISAHSIAGHINSREDHKKIAPQVK